MKIDKHTRFQRVACIILAGLLALSQLGSTVAMLLG